MSVNYAYNYAIIDETGWCYNFISCTYERNDPYSILVPVNDPEYINKYYIDGNWYEDADGTIPWTSSLL